MAVYEWQINQFMATKQLNMQRWLSSSVYVPVDSITVDGVLIVAGGYGEGEDSIEYLKIDKSYRFNEWLVCEDKLPYLSLIHISEPTRPY